MLVAVRNAMVRRKIGLTSALAEQAVRAVNREKAALYIERRKALGLSVKELTEKAWITIDAV